MGRAVGADERLRAGLHAAVSGAGGARAAADKLCQACVELLDVDGAAICLTLDASNRGTFGASSQRSRWLDAVQFTAGHGPCLDAVAHGDPVLVADLDDPTELRWPGFTGAALDAGIRAVFALPVLLSRRCVGALTLHRVQSGPLSAAAFRGGMLAAELATLPLLDVVAEHAVVTGPAATAGDTRDEDGRGRSASLEAVEVYQATGMIMSALDVDPVEALVRLRAQAFLHGITAGELAWAVVERRVALDSPDWQELDVRPRDARDPDGTVGPSR